MTTGEHFIRAGCAPAHKPYEYKACGLDGVFLANGVEVDVVDGEEFVHVQDVEGLHRAIALHLVENRKALAGKEIKFIRRVMDMTQSELAKHLGSTSQSVARWEKGQTDIPGAADLLLRVNFLVSLLEPEEFADLVKNLPGLLDQKDEGRNEPVNFRHGDDAWKEAA